MYNNIFKIKWNSDHSMHKMYVQIKYYFRCITKIIIYIYIDIDYVHILFYESICQPLYLYILPWYTNKHVCNCQSKTYIKGCLAYGHAIILSTTSLHNARSFPIIAMRLMACASTNILITHPSLSTSVSSSSIQYIICW